MPIFEPTIVPKSPADATILQSSAQTAACKHCACRIVVMSCERADSPCLKCQKAVHAWPCSKKQQYAESNLALALEWGERCSSFTCEARTTQETKLASALMNGQVGAGPSMSVKTVQCKWPTSWGRGILWPHTARSCGLRRQGCGSSEARSISRKNPSG